MAYVSLDGFALTPGSETGDSRFRWCRLSKKHLHSHDPVRHLYETSDVSWEWCEWLESDVVEVAMGSLRSIIRPQPFCVTCQWASHTGVSCVTCPHPVCLHSWSRRNRSPQKFAHLWTKRRRVQIPILDPIDIPERPIINNLFLCHAVCDSIAALCTYLAIHRQRQIHQLTGFFSLSSIAINIFNVGSDHSIAAEAQSPCRPAASKLVAFRMKSFGPLLPTLKNIRFNRWRRWTKGFIISVALCCGRSVF